MKSRLMEQRQISILCHFLKTFEAKSFHSDTILKQRRGGGERNRRCMHCIFVSQLQLPTGTPSAVFLLVFSPRCSSAVHRYLCYLHQIKCLFEIVMGANSPILPKMARSVLIFFDDPSSWPSFKGI